MTALNEIEEALNDLTWLANTSAHPHQEEITERYENIRQALTKLAALRDGCVMVPRTPNKRIIAAMKKCEGGEYSIRESWTLIIEAATTEKPNDE